LPRCRIVHVVHPTGTSVSFHTGPTIILSRFFGKKVILDYRDDPSGMGPAQTRSFLMWLIGLCDGVVVSSDYLQYLPAEAGVKADVLGEIVDNATFTPRVVTVVQPKIVLAGPLERSANVPCALKAFRLVKQKYPRAEMMVIGDGSARSALERMAVSENIHGVTFAGRVDRRERIRCFAEADVYLSSSSVDTIPRSLLWALAAGLPIVTTDTGGVAEIIRDGVNGFLVRSGDAARMADGIIRLVETPELAARLSSQARLTAEKHSWDNVKGQWLDFYASLYR
jgi:glycosyltransferase involved in cell wall biosynthesis